MTAPYERLSLYDAPGVALAQILEDEASFRSLKNTVLSPSSLSPEQRTDLANRLAGQSENPFTIALAGVVTNPFIWLMTATMGVAPVMGAASRVAAKGKSIWQTSEKVQKRMLKDTGLWAMFMPASMRLLGTSAAPQAGIIQQKIESVAQFATRVEDGKIVGGGTGFRLKGTLHAQDRVARAVGEATGSKSASTGQLTFDNLSDASIRKTEDVDAVELMTTIDGLFAAKAAGLGGRSRGVPVGRTLWRNAKGDHLPNLGDLSEAQAYANAKVYNKEIHEVYEPQIQEAVDKGQWDRVSELRNTRDEKLFKDYGKADRWTKITKDPEYLGEREIDEALSEMARVIGVSRDDLDQLYRYKQNEYRLSIVKTIGEEDRLTPEILTKLEAGDATAWDGFEFRVDRKKVKRFINGSINATSAQDLKGNLYEDFTQQGYELIASMVNNPERFRGNLNKLEIDKLAGIIEEGVGWNQPGSFDFYPRTNHAPAPFMNKAGQWERPRAQKTVSTDAEANVIHRVAPLTEKEAVWDVTDIERISELTYEHTGVGLITDTGRDNLTKLGRRIDRRTTRASGPKRVLRLQYFGTHERQLSAMGKLKVNYTDGDNLNMLLADAELVKGGVDKGSGIILNGVNIGDEARSLRNDLPLVSQLEDSNGVFERLDGEDIRKLREVITEHNDAADGLTLRQRMEQKIGKAKTQSVQTLVEDVPAITWWQKTTQNLEDFQPGAGKFLDEVVYPISLDEAPFQARAATAAHIYAEERAAAAARGEGALGKVLVEAEKMGSKGAKEMRENLARLSELDAAPRWLGEGTAAGIAGHLYRTHLGVNPGSVLLNLMQPLTLLAGMADSPFDVAAGYKRAFAFSTEYGKLRTSRFGTKLITDEQRTGLINEALRKAYKGVDEELIPTAVDLGLTENVMSTLDHAFRGSKTTRPLDLVLKPFEKTEWFNRVVTAEAHRKMYLRRALPYKGSFQSEYRDSMDKMVSSLQFGNTPINTPGIFLKGGALGNPLARQFLSFPTRTLAMAFMIPQLDNNLWRGAARFAAMGLGMSALTYEVLKPFGINMDRGLLVESVSSAVDVEKGPAGIPLPPIATIVLDMGQGILGGDAQQMGRTLMRALVPGGVALARLPRTGPRLPTFMGDLLQNEYVDWESPIELEGRALGYPVMTRDGRLVEYRTKAEIIGRGLGVDAGSYQEQGGLDQYLLKQRENVAEARRQMLDALARNDTGRARRIAQRFERQYGFPLTATQSQLSGFMRSRTVGRTERILDRTDPQLRELLAQQVKRAGYARNTDVTSGLTASQRERSGSELEIEELRRRLDAVGGGGAPSRGFQGFEGY